MKMVGNKRVIQVKTKNGENTWKWNSKKVNKKI